MTAPHDPPAAYDDLNVRSIALVGGVGAVLVFVAIVAVQVLYFRFNETQFEEKVLAVPTQKANATLASQQERLATAGDGADPTKNEKSIPIAVAMAEVVKAYQTRQAAGAESSSPEPPPAETPRPAEPPQPAQDQPEQAQSAEAGAAAVEGDAEAGSVEAERPAAEQPAAE